MSPDTTTQVALDRASFQQQYDVIWGAHEWPADAVLPVSYEETVGNEALATTHVPVHDADKIWETICSVGSDRKIWVGIAPRSMNGILARIEENKVWNLENGDAIRAFNEENKEAIKEKPGMRKKLRVTNLKWMRGTKDECYPMAGFALDLDVSMESSEHDEHKMDKPLEDGKAPKIFPSAAVAEQWVEDCPLPHVLKIWTGGGFHIWYAVDELMSSEAQEQALARFKAYWVGVKESTGMHIDVGTLEVTRVMRPAGSLKGKGKPDVYFSPIETVEYNPQARFTAADIDLLPVYVDPRRVQRVPNADGTVTLRPVSARSQAEKDALPGTKLSHNLPVSVLLEDVLEFHRDGDKFKGRIDGDYNVVLRTAYDGAELVRAYGERNADTLNLDSSRSYSSFGLLINHWCQGDAALAARIAAHYESHPEGLVKMLRDVKPTAEELAATFPRPVIIDDALTAAAEEPADATPISDDATPGAAVEVDQEIQKEINEALAPAAKQITTVKEAFEEGKFLKVQLSGDKNLFVQVGNSDQTGLWERYLEPNPEDPEKKKLVEKFRRIADWVAWRSEAVTPFRIGSDGKAVPAAEPKFTVQLINPYGVFEAHELSAKDSVDSAVVLDKLNSGSSLPVTTLHKKHMDNMLRTLGRHDAQNLVDKFTSTGILYENGKHIYLTPAGSITAEGVTTRYSVDAPAGSEKGALREAQAAYGFDRIAEGEELRKAAESLKGYLAITPKRLDFGVATFGALPASVLPQNRYTTVATFAKPFSGKSMAASCLQSFVSGVGVDGSSFSLTFSNKSTAIGAGLVSGWHSNSVGFYDDYRISGLSKEDDARTAAFESIVQSSYGADGRAAGVAEGGLRANRKAVTTSVITGEGAPGSSGEAIDSRYVTVNMEFGDYEISPRGSSPLDDFVERFARTGLARAFFASYVQWVIQRIDAAGSIEAFKTEVNKRKNSWESEVSGRAVEAASTLAVGWLYLHDWAAEKGISEFLPDMDSVSAELLALAVKNAEKTANMAPGRRMLAKISEMITGGEGYVNSHKLDSPVPVGNERRLGWERGYQDEWSHGNRVLIGHLSEDREWIHVTSSALGKVRTALGMSGMGTDQTVLAMEKVVRPGTKGNTRASTSLGLDDRVRGYTISVEDLELDLKPLPQAPAAPSALKASKPAVPVADEDDNF